MSTPPHDPEVEGELLDLRHQIIAATRAEQDVVTWTHQHLRRLGVLEESFSFLLSPEEMIEKGEGAFSALIQSLSDSRFSFDASLQRHLKTYYQGYLDQYLTALPEQQAALREPRVIIQSESMGPYRITQEMAYQILSTNSYGDIVRGKHGGSHPVSCQGQVFFKRAVQYEDAALGSQLPLQPAMEAGMYHAYRLLFGEGYLAPTSFLTFKNVLHQTVDLERSPGLTARQKEVLLSNTQTYGLGAYLGGSGLSDETKRTLQFKPRFSSYVAQGALAVPGVTLLNYVRTQNSIPVFDKRSYSAHVLGSYVFPTQDAKFDNFMVVEDKEHGTQKLVGIDNDLALDPVLKEGSRELNLKNALYLCEKEMHQSIDPSLRHFITQIPADLFLIHWLKALNTLGQRYEDLYQHGMISDGDYHFNGLPFMLSASQLIQVGKNLLTLQRLFKESFYGQRITPQQLLLALYPEIHPFYQSLQDKLRERSSSETPPIIEVQFMEIFGEARPEIPASPRKKALSDSSLQRESPKQPVAEVLETVISEFILSHQRKDWGEVLETLAETFPDQTKALLLSLKEREDIYPLIHHPEFVLQVIKEGRRVSVLKLMRELGFKISPSLFPAVIRHMPESKGIEWLEALKGLSLETEEHPETPLELAMHLHKHQYVSWLIHQGAGHQISFRTAMDYLERLTPEERRRFEEVLPLLEKRNARLRWELIMNTFLPPRRNHPDLEGIDIQTTHNKRVLKREFVNQLWEAFPNGFKRSDPYGRRKVGLLKEGRYKMYVKEHPELPGTEEAVGILTRTLLGYGAPHTLLGRVGEKAYLFCEGIEGENLQSYFTGSLSWSDLKERLDDYSFQGLALMALLTYPEDGKPDNFIVEEQEDGRYRFIGIDNDHAFVPSVAPKKLFQRSTDRVQVKSILFTMDQMTQPLHPRIRHQFLYHNPREILERWIETLTGVRGSYDALFSREEVLSYFKKEGSFIGVGIHPNTIHKLYRDLVDLQYLVEQTPDLTLLNVMEEFNKPLYDRYRHGFSVPRLSALNPYERFLEIDGPDYQRDRTHSLRSSRSASLLLSSMKVEGRTLLEYIQSDHYDAIAPETALQKLKEIAEADTKTVVRRVLEREGRYVPLQEMTDPQREDFFKRLDWSKLRFSDQQALFDQLTTVPFRGSLVLNNCAVLTKDVIQKLPWETLTEVTLRVEREMPVDLRESLRFIPEGKEVRLKFKALPLLTDDLLDELVQQHKMKSLELEDCSAIKDPELRQKAPHLVWRNMSQLPEGVRAKLREVLIHHEKTLDLRRNRIGSAGAQVLAAVLKDSQIMILNLRRNRIGSAGAQALAAVLKDTQITTLDLGENRIGSAGAQVLAAVLKDTQITTLDLGDNQIGEQILRDLEEILHQNKEKIRDHAPSQSHPSSAEEQRYPPHRLEERDVFLSPFQRGGVSERTPVQRASHLLLNPDVDYREVLELLFPLLSTSSEAFDLCFEKVAPRYPKAYLDLAKSVGPMEQKLIYVRKALERGEGGAIVLLEEWSQRDVQALLDLAFVYKEGMRKDLERARTLYRQGIDQRNSAECRYQLARLCIEQEDFKEGEQLLREAMEQGHGESHLFWHTLKSKQKDLVVPQEMLEEEKEQLSEQRNILRALTQAVRRGSADSLERTLLGKTLREEQRRGLESVLKKYKDPEESIKAQIIKTKKELEDLSFLSPHYKRLQQLLVTLEENLERHRQRKQRDLERVVLEERGHYAGVISSRQNLFYEKLCTSLRDQLDILRLTEDGLVKAVLKSILDQAEEIDVDFVLVEKAVSTKKAKPFNPSVGVIAAVYTYRLQDLVPLLTDQSQSELAHLLSLNFIDFITQQKPEEMKDVSDLLSQSFYHQKETLGGKINKLFKWDKLDTIYKETLLMRDIFTSATLRTSDGAEWRDKDALTIKGQPVYYKVPLLEIVDLKNKGRTLAQVSAPHLSLLEKEILLPQDSETYLKDALHFVSHLQSTSTHSTA